MCEGQERLWEVLSQPFVAVITRAGTGDFLLWKCCLPKRGFRARRCERRSKGLMFTDSVCTREALAGERTWHKKGKLA